MTAETPNAPAAATPSRTPLGQSQTPIVPLDEEVVRAFAELNLPEADKFSDAIKNTLYYGVNPANPLHFGNTQNNFAHKEKIRAWVIEEMFRAGCPEEVIRKVMQWPGFVLGVRDYERKGEAYLDNLINRARDWAFNDGTALINREYFAVLEGKRIIFYREEKDNSITAMNAEAFSFATAPLKVTIKTTDAKGNPKEVEAEAAKIWRASERRRFYSRGFVLDPTFSQRADEYNLWKGFGVEPKPGDWSLLRRHIEMVLAGGIAEYADYILNWTAWTFQNPATPPRVALVFRGEEGTGKGIYGRALVTAFGSHGQRVQNIGHVAGRFNAHMRHCCMFFADEVSLVSDDQEGNLKGMITEPTLPIEAKGVDIVHAENHLHVVMASNREFVIPAGIGARRFAMFDVPDTYKGNAEYWGPLYEEIERGGGIAAMLDELLKRPLGNWHPESARVDTAALDDQKARNLPPLPRTWLNSLQSGTLPGGHIWDGGKVFLPTVRLIDFLNQKLGLRDKEQITPTALGFLFGKFGFTKIDRRPRGWNIAALPEARRLWNEKMNMKILWDETKDWQVTDQIGPPLEDTDKSPF